MVLNGTTLSAPVLVTGGHAGATGETIIHGGTEMYSRGTRIHVGKGAQIRISGNAQIRQT